MDIKQTAQEVQQEQPAEKQKLFLMCPKCKGTLFGEVFRYEPAKKRGKPIRKNTDISIIQCAGCGQIFEVGQFPSLEEAEKIESKKTHARLDIPAQAQKRLILPR